MRLSDYLLMIACPVLILFCIGLTKVVQYLQGVAN